MGRWSTWAGMLAISSAAPLIAQTLSNQSLTGKYYFRQVSLGTDSSGSITDPRTVTGSITFDGNGHFTFSGQQLNGSDAAVPASGSGAYTFDSAGSVSMDSPVRSGDKVNARWGSEVLVGSSTESAGNTFDMLVAVRAPTNAPVLAGASYWVATLEFGTGGGKSARNTFFNLVPQALGRIAGPFAVIGHATNINAGQPVEQGVAGGSYTMAADGSGSMVFGAASNSTLLSGVRNFYESADGNTLIGGSPGSHDILVGIKSVTVGANNSSFNGNYWVAGLRYAPFAQPTDVTSYSGSLAARGQGILTWARRIKALSFGAYDFTGLNDYSLSTGSGGVSDLLQIGLGTGGKSVLASAIHPNDPGAYEIYLGVQMNSLSGTGVFLNPQGVTSAASFVPPGAPIAPGEFIALFGTGLAGSTQASAPPYGALLNNVTVTINNRPAPLYFVSATQIDCLVPYATEGPSATIVVQNNGANSNAVTVPVAATAPGIFSQNQSGTGLGAILHPDYSLVSAGKPAAAGETVQIFLTGMGAVNPAVPDGTAGGSSPFSLTKATPIYVLVGGLPATVSFSGLAPGYPGLYQINATLPSPLATGVYPLSIQTPNAFHNLVSIPIK